MRKLFVLGSPRSGTTWIAAILSRSRLYRLVFEPEIHEARSICDREFHGDPVEARVQQEFQKILDNRLVDLRSYRHGVTRFGYHRWNWLIRVLVVKLIRCNLALDYLGSRPRSRCVFVLRCPRATIRSQARVAFGHLPELGTLLSNSGARGFVEERGWARPDLTFVETLALRWVIENVYAVQAADPSAGHVFVEYEQLRDRPGLWHELLGELGLRVAADALGDALAEPSATSFPDRAAYQLSAADEAAMESLLTSFGVDEFQDAFRQRAVGSGRHSGST